MTMLSQSFDRDREQTIQRNAQYHERAAFEVDFMSFYDIVDIDPELLGPDDNRELEAMLWEYQDDQRAIVETVEKWLEKIRETATTAHAANLAEGYLS